MLRLPSSEVMRLDPMRLLKTRTSQVITFTDSCSSMLYSCQRRFSSFMKAGMVVGVPAHVRGTRLPFGRVRTLLSMLMLVSLVACKRPAYDTTTPDAALDAAVAMVQQGQAQQLPGLIEIEELAKNTV